MDGEGSCDDLLCLCLLLPFVWLFGCCEDDKESGSDGRPYEPLAHCAHCNHCGGGAQPCPSPAGQGAPTVIVNGNGNVTVNGQGTPYGGGPVPQYGGQGITYAPGASVISEGYPVGQALVDPQGGTQQPPTAPPLVVAQFSPGQPPAGKKV